MRVLMAAVLCVGFAFGAVSECSAQGARPMGMGGAFIGLADDVNAVGVNPAGMAFLRNPEATMTLSYADVGYATMGDRYLALAYPVSRGPWSVGLSTQRTWWELEDYDKSSSDTQTLSAAYRLSPKTSVGLNLRNVDLRERYLHCQTGVDLSILHKINEKWSFGVVFENVNEPEVRSDYVDPWSETVMKFPMLVSPGFAYRANKNTVVTGDVIGFAESDRNLSLRLGVEHRGPVGLALRGGYRETDSDSFLTFGVGKKFGKAQVDAAVVTDDVDSTFVVSASSMF